ncbi:hypothetical protein I601_3300 [Nocardioides dokdonensis FR1436]|uniref:N-acetyltransferase domain-containing protein n=1 Tax=Nocardioides dokdonensis FR1436 TaxID=1300347 RepID=A0A1A9GN09_9ACTN|nr:GNAT family N-acetyltransferase [Nocardioides dokdonensis]ANH39707.1 hypothetical protein I601_3300 [Nocardioides dokdonensis FR1436]
MIGQTHEDHPLVPAASLRADQLGRVRDIYDEAFPEELRVPFEDLLVDRLLVRVSGSGQPEGLAVVRALGPTGWTFLRYYAVGARGGGIGSAMLDQLAAALAREGGSLLVWDVEDPDEPGLSPSTSRSTCAGSGSTSATAPNCCRWWSTALPTTASSPGTPPRCG